MKPLVLLALVMLSACATTSDDERRLARYEWFACATRGEGKFPIPPC